MKVVLAIVGLALAACSPHAATQPGTMPDLDGDFEFDRLEIVNDVGETLVFDVYLAQTDAQRSRGLMYVRSMPERTGMWFIYDQEDIRSMWMKNTYIPLDMFFVRADGSVASIITDTVPRTLNSQLSKEPVQYVLELNAGSARRFDIGRNSRIIWSKP